MTRRPVRLGGFARARKRPLHEESDLQIDLIRFYDKNVSPADALCYAVPNGEARDEVTGGILKAQGVRSGVSDLVILTPNARSTYVELKLPKRVVMGVQKEKTYLKPEQKAFKERIEALGFRYVVVRSLVEFVFLLDELGVPLRARPAGTFSELVTISSS